MNNTIRYVIKEIYDKYLLNISDAKNDYYDFIKNNNEYIERDTFFYFSVEINNIDYAKMIIEFEGLQSLFSKNNKFFQHACFHGNKEIATYLLELWPLIDISSDDNYALKWSIIRGHKNIYDWLLDLNPEFNLINLSEFIFEMSCTYNNIDAAKWMYDINPNISFIKNPIYHTLKYDRFDKNNDFDTGTCGENELSDLDSDTSDISFNCDILDNPISIVFDRHFLQLSQWLKQIIPNIVFTFKEAQSIFYSSSIKNMLDFSKWFYSIMDQNYIHKINFSEIFEKTILYNYYDIVKWFLEIKPEIEIDFPKVLLNSINKKKDSLNIFIHILQLKNNLKNLIDNKELFIAICSFGNIEFFNTALNIGFIFEINYDNYKPFLYACIYDNIEMAEYLFKNYSIDLKTNNDFIIKKCIKKDSHINTIIWLSNLLPDRYNFNHELKILTIYIDQNNTLEYDFSYFTLIPNDKCPGTYIQSLEYHKLKQKFPNEYNNEFNNNDDNYEFNNNDNNNEFIDSNNFYNNVIEYKDIEDNIIESSKDLPDDFFSKPNLSIGGILDDLSDYE